jgi:16S rRNA (cytidine1402-2'-O)-methyltransferase
MVLVVAGAVAEAVNTDTLVEQVLALTADGTGLKDAVAEIADATGASKKELYQLVLEQRKTSGL